METERHGTTWLSSYPKSGNTWLRCLLEAYRRNGTLDINDIRFSTGDGGATVMQGVSPMPLKALDFQIEMLLRPAALFNLFCRLNQPIFTKTHFANIQPDGLPHCIPRQFTENAIYVVRDPRSVISSFARFYNFPIETAADAMSSKDFIIGGSEMFCRILLSTWSNHVNSWLGEKEFPVHVVKYEDMVEDAGKELTGVLEFLGTEVNAETVAKAVEATNISKISQEEKDNGFKESVNKSSGRFFNGGSDWRHDLGQKWIKRIEEDHGETMKLLGYLDNTQAIKAVS